MPRQKNFVRIVFFLLLILSAAVLYVETPAADTPRRSAPSDLVTRTFYLENAEVRDVMTALRSLAGAKNIVADETLNSVALRDTAANVALAEEIVLAHDRPRNEIVVHVELLQFDPRELHALAAEMRKQDGKAEDIPLRLTADDLARLKEAESAVILAHPKLSVLAGKTAQLVIGDRVPIAAGAEGAVQYQEVGFQLEVASRVHPNDREVTLDLRMEVSQRSAEGAERLQPVVETRKLDSSIRLRDGETWFLTGLMHADKSPFRHASDEHRGEIVLALTPHVTRQAGAGTLSARAGGDAGGGSAGQR